MTEQATCDDCRVSNCGSWGETVELCPKHAAGDELVAALRRYESARIAGGREWDYGILYEASKLARNALRSAGVET